MGYPKQQRAAFDVFAGWGASIPSDAFRVTDEDAGELMDIIREADFGSPLWSANGYEICAADFSESSNATVLYAGTPVGFYEGSCLWIAAEHRRKGLSTPLILAAVLDRSSAGVVTVLPRDVDMQGYSKAGLAAHRRAFKVLWQAGCDPRAALAQYQQWGIELTHGVNEMESVKTKHTHTGVTVQEVVGVFGASGGAQYTVVVPAGTRCAKLEGGSAPWVVDDLSFIGNTRSLLYRDADIYGIRVDETDITEIAEAGSAPLIVTSAFGSWSPNVPAGMVGVYAAEHGVRTAPKTHWLIDQAEYQAINRKPAIDGKTEDFVIDRTRHQRVSNDGTFGVGAAEVSAAPTVRADDSPQP